MDFSLFWFQKPFICVLKGTIKEKQWPVRVNVPYGGARMLA